MQAALVPTEEERWQSVENEIINTICEVSELLKNKVIDRLHMYDNEFSSGTFPFSPYQFAFQLLLGSIEQVLKKLEGYGILIIDQKRQEEVLSKLNTYRVLRAANILTRIIENPIFRDSRENAMLTVPDFAAYIIGRSVSDEILNKKSPDKIVEWKEKYIIPQTGAYFPENDNVWEISGFESFKSRLQQLLKGEGPPIISIPQCILLLMFHEMIMGGDLRKCMSIGRGLQIFSGRYIS